ncbi:MAG TPA: tetratricopeptide repeat protein [Usitatibacter sp.]|jgi:predicted negative regulator of RcsB-dependent stress response|nr:tetratricopeptide repeat protein [Usitatibacter sp.]
MSGSYDFEEQERIAELKAWWEDNRWYVVGAIVVAIVAFAGWQGWQMWKQKRAGEAAALYRPVAEAAKGDDPKRIADAAKPLFDRAPDSFQASEAALMLAKAAFAKGDLAEAQKQLQWVVANGAAEHRPVARLRLAAVLLEQKKYDDALKVLDDNKDAAFAPLVDDARGDVMLAAGRIDEARASYKAAIDASGPRNPVRQVAQTKLDALGGGQ